MDDGRIDHLPIEQQIEILFGDFDREMRLQQLREEFEAKRDEWLDVRVSAHAGSPPHFIPRRDLWPAIVGNTAEQWASADAFFNCMEVAEKAQHYIIARDWGEFDRERALMLYKLQAL